MEYGVFHENPENLNDASQKAILVFIRFLDVLSKIGLARRDFPQEFVFLKFWYK